MTDSRKSGGFFKPNQNIERDRVIGNFARLFSSVQISVRTSKQNGCCMNIYIKSFNRPAYLDRCLASIHKHVNGAGRLVVLDDGTPERYLKRLLERHPSVEIRRSSEADRKANAIDRIAAGDPMEFPASIPAKFWRDCADEETGYFCVIEDDMWFVQDFDLEKARETAGECSAAAIKLLWLGNRHLETTQSLPCSNDFLSIEPLYIRLPLITRFMEFYLRHLQIHHRRAAHYLHLSLLWNTYWKATGAPYLTYTIAGLIAHADYWKAVQTDARCDRFDESLQVRNHLRYIRSNRVKFLRPLHEVTSTSFLSSAYRKKGRGVHAFDLLAFNRIISEAWYRGDFDPTAFLPNDFPVHVIENLMKTEERADCNAGLWKAWRNDFASRYLSQGFQIPNAE